MAKQKAADNSANDSAMSVDNIFKQLVKQHNEQTLGSASIGNQLSAEVKMYIPTGSTELDVVLSNKRNGGWPVGRIIEIFGPESIGKSTICYQAMANTQKMGGITILFDAEQAASKDMMQMCGVDLSKCIISDHYIIEDLFLALQKNLELIAASKEFKNKPVLVVLDSLTALQTLQESESTYVANMNTALLKPKQLGLAFKKITPYLNKANATLIVINQVRENTTGYGEQFVTGGGRALKFYSSIRLFLKGKEKIVDVDPAIENAYQEALAAWKTAGGNKSGLDKPTRGKGDETTVGFKIEAFTKKNKVAPPERTGKFSIIFTKGIRDEDSWFDTGVQYGMIKKNGNRYEIVAFPNDAGLFYSSQWLDVISDVEIHTQLKELIIQKLVRPIDLANIVTYEVEEKDDEEFFAEKLTTA